ncbi:KAP family P-loop NTPase fold protein [Wolbachia endosymbiont of Pentidionis agamae]|uniref:KAP family P-loop NTPase fold protein n=1 Tax=Wolbachia endosymbiont of Pentidionis agamae TaxID=3110435 RepID=UPI002FD0BA8D
MCFKKLLSFLKPKKKTVIHENIWQDSYFEYEQTVNKFNTILSTLESTDRVISLEGYSGFGKTFFLKKWIKTLESQNEIAVYYDAWDIYSLEQPLVSFLNFLFEDLFVKYKIRKSAITQLKSINQELFSLNTVNKLISKSPLGMFSVLFDATKEAEKKDIGSVLQDLNSLKRRKAGMQDFQNQFTKIVNKIRNGKNIYIMVDNLDICRPKFIVDFLEAIKYTLNIEGIVVILAISRDKSNVYKAINTLLGANFDLSFFTNLSLYLSKGSVNLFIKKLFEDSELQKKSLKPILDKFTFFAKNMSLSLKTIDYCTKKVKLSLSNYRKKELPFIDLFLFLIILQVTNNKVYEELWSSYKTALEKIEDEYKIMVLNNQEEWEILKSLLKGAFDTTIVVSNKHETTDNRIIYQIKNMID